MKRGQIIKQVILDKCKETETLGYTNLKSSDITDILNTLSQKGIKLSKEEMNNLGFERVLNSKNTIKQKEVIKA